MCWFHKGYIPEYTNRVRRPRSGRSDFWFQNRLQFYCVPAGVAIAVTVMSRPKTVLSMALLRCARNF